VGLKDKELISLQEIEGAVSPHRRQMDTALQARQKALEYVDEVSKLAEFIGGRVESLGLHEDWTISKQIFPGVEIFFIFNHADEELPSSLRVLYSGNRIKLMKGDDLTGITIPHINHMLRYVREANPDKKLPEVCYKV